MCLVVELAQRDRDGGRGIRPLRTVEGEQMIKRNIDIEISISPRELTTVFCNLDADSQASFFNWIAEISGQWAVPFCLQLQAIIDSDVLVPSGRLAMEAIGDYGKAWRPNIGGGEL